MGGQVALGIDPGVALLDGHAIQFHRPSLHLAHRLHTHVLGNGHWQRQIVVHPGLLPDGQHLQLHLLGQLLGDGVVGAQGVEQILHRGGGQVKVAAPLFLPLGRGGGVGGAGVKVPVALLVLGQPELVDGGLAVGLHQFDGLDDGLGIGRPVLVAGARGVPVKLHVEGFPVIGQRGHVGVVNGAPLAGQRQCLGCLRLGLLSIVGGQYDLQIVHLHPDQGEYPYNQKAYHHVSRPLGPHPTSLLYRAAYRDHLGLSILLNHR